MCGLPADKGLHVCRWRLLRKLMCLHLSCPKRSWTGWLPSAIRTMCLCLRPALAPPHLYVQQTLPQVFALAQNHQPHLLSCILLSSGHEQHAFTAVHPTRGFSSRHDTNFAHAFELQCLADKHPVQSMHHSTSPLH